MLPAALLFHSETRPPIRSVPAGLHRHLSSGIPHVRVVLGFDSSGHGEGIGQRSPRELYGRHGLLEALASTACACVYFERPVLIGEISWGAVHL